MQRLMLVALAIALVQAASDNSKDSKKKFHLFMEKETWNDAFLRCRLKGMFLATIRTSEEDRRLHGMLSIPMDINDAKSWDSFTFWIGARAVSHTSNHSVNWYWMAPPLEEVAFSVWNLPYTEPIEDYTAYVTLSTGIGTIYSIWVYSTDARETNYFVCESTE